MKISAALETLQERTGRVLARRSRFEPLEWALRALWLETFGFRFNYPLELVPEAGPRSSLHYYVYSNRLFFDLMELDQDGIPFHRTRALGKFYNPAYVAWYALMTLERSLRQREKTPEAFTSQIEWLVKNAVRQSDESVVWFFPVDVKEGRARLKAPWISAMIQGLAVSALVRAARLELGPSNLLELCRSALDVFGKGISEGGVRTAEEGRVLFEEYPAYPLPRVLDGFLFSLLGLYDLWVESQDALAKRMFDEGVAGLVRSLEFWNYEDCWSWYGSHGYLCPASYHNLNRLLLTALANATSEKILRHYAEAWNPARLTLPQRAKLFAVFLALKQRARIRGWRDGHE